MAALFEPLIQPHPQTMAPMAGLATHYKIERDGARYTFYLRGHVAPEGIQLAGPDSLPAEFSRGRASAPHNTPARWSDGVAITAHDMVYSWRRDLAPDTANPNAYLLYCVAGAEAVNQGRLPPGDATTEPAIGLTICPKPGRSFTMSQAETLASMVAAACRYSRAVHCSRLSIISPASGPQAGGGDRGEVRPAPPARP